MTRDTLIGMALIVLVAENAYSSPDLDIYEVIDLGIFIGNYGSEDRSWAVGISDSGDVAGGGPNVLASGRTIALLWKPGQDVQVLTNDGALNYVATDMNSFGTVSGYRGSPPRACVWFGGYYDGNLPEVSDPPSGPYPFRAFALGVSDSGLVCGNTTWDTRNAPGDFYDRATLWTGSGPIDLGVLDGYQDSVANDVNSIGIVTGECIGGPDGIRTGFVTLMPWEMTPLDPVAGYDSCWGSGISESGVVVGTSAGNLGYVATVWNGGGAFELPTPSNASGSSALVSCNSGDILGHCTFPDREQPYAAIWHDGSVFKLVDDMTSSDDSQNYSVIELTGINSRGWMCGTAIFFDQPGSPEHAVRLVNRCNVADQSLPFAVLDLADINSFVSNFFSGDPDADFNDDQIFDLADIVVFVDEFQRGCL